ncbi:thioredoxin domain-containing protein [Xenorhabdus sp. TH1]|uniref:DsbA family protein n=1 Tax=Xenorhabdus sp. TH1 TaxID=3130166 RepID=UPI0030CC3092
MESNFSKCKPVIVKALLGLTVVATAINTAILLKTKQDVAELQVAVDHIKIPAIKNDTDLNGFFKKYILASGYNQVMKRTKPNTVSDNGAGDTLSVNDEKEENAINQPSSDNDRIYGNVNAPFLLIHYSDFECEYCQSEFPEMVGFVDSSGGNVALVFKHTLGHGKRSLYLSTLVECAYQQKGNYGFFELAKYLFDSKRNGSFNVPIKELANNFSLDEKTFGTCVNNGGGGAKIAFDTQEAIGLNLDRTPSTIISYKSKAVLVQGAVPITEIQAVMGQLTQTE